MEGLGLAAEAMADELHRLQVAETGGLAIDQLSLLHDTTTELMMDELRTTEQAADAAERLHAAAASKLRKREADLVLLIQSYARTS